MTDDASDDAEVGVTGGAQAVQPGAPVPAGSTPAETPPDPGTVLGVPVAAPEVPAGAVLCPVCGEPSLAGEKFCENCGADLTGTAGDQAGPPPEETPDHEQVRPCAACGGTAFADGYCEQCGAPAVKERDHWSEQPVSWVAGVSDRGLSHSRNEDAMAVSAQDGPDRLAALVVCDGVSTSADSDVASLAAARAARDVLRRDTSAGASVAGRISAWTDLLGQAAAAANDAVLRTVATEAGRMHGGRPVSPPSCTFVAAVVDGPVVVAGSVGDSRAYWVPDEGPAQQLTVDDSWATEQIAMGVPREEAETGPQAHAITRWLGPDTPDFTPRCATVTPDRPGLLVVCSDGLWNYCSPADHLAELVRSSAAATGGDLVALGEALVAWANQQGGHDNITVAVARLEPEGT